MRVIKYFQPIPIGHKVIEFKFKQYGRYMSYCGFEFNPIALISDAFIDDYYMTVHRKIDNHADIPYTNISFTKNDNIINNDVFKHSVFWHFDKTKVLDMSTGDQFGYLIDRVAISTDIMHCFFSRYEIEPRIIQDALPDSYIFSKTPDRIADVLTGSLLSPETQEAIYDYNYYMPKQTEAVADIRNNTPAVEDAYSADIPQWIFGRKLNYETLCNYNYYFGRKLPFDAFLQSNNPSAKKDNSETSDYDHLLTGMKQIYADMNYSELSPGKISSNSDIDWHNIYGFKNYVHADILGSSFTGIEKQNKSLYVNRDNTLATKKSYDLWRIPGTISVHKKSRDLKEIDNYNILGHKDERDLRALDSHIFFGNKSGSPIINPDENKLFGVYKDGRPLMRNTQELRAQLYAKPISRPSATEMFFTKNSRPLPFIMGSLMLVKDKLPTGSFDGSGAFADKPSFPLYTNYDSEVSLAKLGKDTHMGNDNIGTIKTNAEVYNNSIPLWTLKGGISAFSFQSEVGFVKNGKPVFSVHSELPIHKALHSSFIPASEFSVNKSQKTVAINIADTPVIKEDQQVYIDSSHIWSYYILNYITLHDQSAYFVSKFPLSSIIDEHGMFVSKPPISVIVNQSIPVIKPPSLGVIDSLFTGTCKADNLTYVDEYSDNIYKILPGLSIAGHTMALRDTYDLKINEVVEASGEKEHAINRNDQVDFVWKISRDIYIESVLIDNWIWSDHVDFDIWGRDELLLPKKDFDYTYYLNQVVDQETMTPINPVQEFPDGSFIAKFPTNHPFPQWEDLAVDYLMVPASIISYCMKFIFDTVQKNPTYYASVDMKSSMERLINELIKHNSMYVPANYRAHFSRVIRMVRWYAEAVIMINSNYKLIPERGYLNILESTGPVTYSCNDMIENYTTKKFISLSTITCDLTVVFQNEFPTSVAATAEITSGFVEIYINGVFDRSGHAGVNTFVLPIEGTSSSNIIKFVFHSPTNNGIMVLSVSERSKITGYTTEYSPIQSNIGFNQILQQLDFFKDIVTDNYSNITLFENGMIGIEQLYQKLDKYWALHHQDKDKGKRITIRRT